MALNFACVSAFEDNENARLVSLGTLQQKRESVDKADIFALQLPFPFLVETVPPPWFSHSQILKTGVGQGLGTSDKNVYLLLLDGIEMIAYYNQMIVQREKKTDFVEDAMKIKRLILSLNRLKGHPSFGHLRDRGVIWTTPGFEHLLCGALDEAYGYEILQRVAKNETIETSELLQILCPIIWYNRVHTEFNLRVVHFRDSYEKIAFFGVFKFIVKNKFCPWHEKRETKNDPETAAALIFFAKNIAANGEFSAEFNLLQDPYNFFVNMVKINCKIPSNIDISAKLYAWADACDITTPSFSRAAALLSQP